MSVNSGNTATDMEKRPMTNEQVNALLMAAQGLWLKYRDNPPAFGDLDALDRMLEEFNAPLKGLPERATQIMLFFISEIYERSKARERQNK